MMTPYSHLQPVAELPGVLGFTVWGLGTRDDVAAILSPGYFGGHARQLHDGDIIVVNRRSPAPVPDRGTEKLILVVDKDWQGTLSLRQILHLPALMFLPEAVAPALAATRPQTGGRSKAS